MGILLLACTASVMAQDQSIDLEDAIDTASAWAEANMDTNVLAAIKGGTPEQVQHAMQQWAQDNLDTNVLSVLSEIDRAKVIRFLFEVQKQLGGDNVSEIARLRDQAAMVLFLLRAHNETAPYAAWLLPRMDYLRVADNVRTATPPPKAEPIPSNWRPPNPDAAKARAMWAREVVRKPWSDNAKKYVPVLKPIFAEQKVPEELVWIAEVESGFDSRARSPVGAAGLFQIMPATARRFGLSLFPRDQRLQPEPSARAAARYLQVLYERFHDWRLVLAAYNSGEGTVQRLLKRHRTKNYDDIAVHLPAETQMYVPKVEATLLRREGMKLSQFR